MLQNKPYQIISQPTESSRLFKLNFECLFFQETDVFNGSKVTINTFILLQEISISTKCNSFKFALQRIMKKSVMISIKIGTTVLNIDDR